MTLEELQKEMTRLGIRSLKFSFHGSKWASVWKRATDHLGYLDSGDMIEEAVRASMARWEKDDGC